MPLQNGATLTRLERRKTRTAEAILDAAERLFFERGYHRTTLQELADAADVAVGSIYAHFESKGGVYLALVERAIAVDKLYFDPAFASERPPREQTALAADAFLRFYRERPALFRLLAWQGGPEDPSADEVPAAVARLRERIEETMDRLARALAEATNSGELRAVDPRLTAKLLWATWSGLVALNAHDARSGVGERELDAIIEQAQDVIAHGLLARDRAEHEASG